PGGAEGPRRRGGNVWAGAPRRWDPGNHSEAGFGPSLRWHRLCHVAVDETRRAMLGDVRVKSLDFIVYGEHGARLLVDVKGRRFPTGPKARPRKVWGNWSTQDDLDGLARWRQLSVPGFQGCLVFAYQAQPEITLPDDTADLWTWRGRRYLLRAVAADDYRLHARVRSPKWGTVYMPGSAFREIVRPFHAFTHPASPVADECPF